MVQNVLAAAGLALGLGAPPGAIRTALGGFHVDHHRTEVVAERGGIRWVDDSKATNPHAARAALAASSVVWIVGGLFKGVDVGAARAKRGRPVARRGADRCRSPRGAARHSRDTRRRSRCSRSTPLTLIK